MCVKGSLPSEPKAMLTAKEVPDGSGSSVYGNKISHNREKYHSVIASISNSILTSSLPKEIHVYLDQNLLTACRYTQKNNLMSQVYRSS